MLLIPRFKLPQVPRQKEFLCDFFRDPVTLRCLPCLFILRRLYRAFSFELLAPWPSKIIYLGDVMKSLLLSLCPIRDASEDVFHSWQKGRAGTEVVFLIAFARYYQRTYCTFR